MHPIDNLHTKLQARDVAEQQYQAALADVREQLGDKFMLSEVGYDMASGSDWTATATAEDMSDPANWRAGDIVECVDEGSTRSLHSYFTNGMEYKLLKNDGSSSFKYMANDGEGRFADNASFRFIRRP